jgi:glycosyltransferase involved in cell wall biosynthesis
MWPTLGPYHCARLEAAGPRFAQAGLDLVALELAGRSGIRDSGTARAESRFQRRTLFPAASPGDIPRRAVVRAVCAALDELQPFAVAVNGWFGPDARAGLLWATRRRRAAVLMSDSKRDDWPRSTLREWVKRRIVSACDAALVAGTPQRRYVEDLGMPPDRVTVGLDVVDNHYYRSRAEAARCDAETLRDRHGLPDRYFLCVARLIPEKNQARLLEAWARYAAAADPARPWALVVCGDGPERDRLHALTHRLGLTQVQWRGHVDWTDLPDFYALAGCLVLPSTKDTWGLAVNEAMAAALPVIASSRAGCCADLLEPGGNGWVVDPFDVRSIAAAISEAAALGEPELARMGERSSRIIAAWDTGRFADALLRAVRLTRHRRPVGLLARAAVHAAALLGPAR